MLRSFLFLAVAFLAFAQTVFAQMDPRAIVVKSVQADDEAARLARNYTYQVRDVHKELDGKGNVKSTEIDTAEILFIGGKRYRRLIQKNDQPLSADEESKESKKVDKAVAEVSRMSQEELDRRYGEFEKKRAADREQLKYIPDAFDFKLLREEAVNGRPAYVIAATPKRDYRGTHHEFLTKMQGTMWIDKEDFHWVKVEAETLDTISFGLFIARLAKGTHMEFEETRVNGEIWLPKRASFQGSARLAVVKKFNVAEEVSFSNYRKFQTDSKIVSTSELPVTRP
jgi:outer membrane lipoprotein-sorting protein